MSFYDKLKFNADGLIPAIVQEQSTGRVLMMEMRLDGSPGDRSEATPTDEEVDQFHRAQRVWDATMGESAARAQVTGSKVIHLEGAFHIGERLGTVGQFTKAVPTAKVLVINLVPEARTVFVEADAHGADIVICTKLTR